MTGNCALFIYSIISFGKALPVVTWACKRRMSIVISQLDSHCSLVGNITISLFFSKVKSVVKVAYLIRGNATWSQTQVLWLRSLCLRPLPWSASCSFPLRLQWSKEPRHSLSLTAVGLCPFGQGGSCQMDLAECLALNKCSWLLRKSKTNLGQMEGNTPHSLHDILKRLEGGLQQSHTLVSN